MKHLRQHIRRIIKEMAEDQTLPFELQATPSELKEIFAMIETSQMENVKSAVQLFNMFEGTDVDVWDSSGARLALNPGVHSGAFKVEIPGGDFVENVGGWRTNYRIDGVPPEYVHPFLVAAANHGFAVDEDLWKGLDHGWIYL